MATAPPPFPAGRPGVFRSTVHGVAFGERAEKVGEVAAGDTLDLHPAMEEEDGESVWVHRSCGDLLGHLPGEIGSWLAPWLRAGGVASVRALKVHDHRTPSWRRLVVEVVCGQDARGAAPMSR